MCNNEKLVAIKYLDASKMRKLLNIPENSMRIFEDYDDFYEYVESINIEEFTGLSEPIDCVFTPGQNARISWEVFEDESIIYHISRYIVYDGMGRYKVHNIISFILELDKCSLDEAESFIKQVYGLKIRGIDIINAYPIKNERVQGNNPKSNIICYSNAFFYSDRYKFYSNICLCYIFYKQLKEIGG